MYTRKQYINGECSHHEYYSQFVTDAVLERIKTSIGVETILESKDEHLNDIPLRRWDNIRVMFYPCVSAIIKEANEGFAPATNVCIGKTAARILAERERKSA